MKYIIDDSTLKKYKTNYVQSAESASKSLETLLNTQIKGVYLLYISSIYYNYDIRADVVKKLANKDINSLFYSLSLDKFYYNFVGNINDIQLKNSLLVYPEAKVYDKQIAYQNIDFENIPGIYKKYNINDIKNKNRKKNKNEGNKKMIKKVSKEEKENIYFLRKKTLREEDDLKKVFNDLISYIKNISKFNNKFIINTLGPLISIENYSNYEINMKTEYAFLFYLNNNNELVKDKKIGLIIENKGNEFYVDLKENIVYEEFMNY